MPLEITDLVSQWGAYYRNEGQGRQSLVKKILTPTVTEKVWSPIIETQNDVEKMGEAAMTRVFQAFQKTFTPIGTFSIVPREIGLQDVKHDVVLHPDDIRRSWAGFTAGDTNDRKAWPIVRYIAEEMILQKSDEDFEEDEVYKGSLSLTPGTATSAGQSFNGLEKSIKAGILAGNSIVVTSPATWSEDPSDFVKQVHEWIADVKLDNYGKKLIKLCDYIFMDEELKDRFARGIHELYDINYAVTGLNIMTYPDMIPVPFTKLKVMGLPSMAGKRRIFMTPPTNRKCFLKRPKSKMILQIESIDRQVKIFGDYSKAVDYWSDTMIITNQID
jgi:hypothetical protein